MIIAGIMSGTSLDGITIAAINLNGRKWNLLEYRTFAYPKKLRERLLAVSDAIAHTGEIAKLNFDLAEQYAKAVQALQHKPQLIGCHGQTIFHGPGCTLQLGEAQVLAERTQTAVVSNFRARDIAAGGQGAPLVPFVDYLLFNSPKKNRVLLNIGGIANVTILKAAGRPEDVVAFDTGPGNMIIDQLAWVISKGKHTYDKDARLAKKGTPNPQLLHSLLQDKYFRRNAPKSCGREQFGRDYIAHLLATQIDLYDLIATVTLLTPVSIYEAIESAKPDELIAAGGGTRNPQIMNHLRGLLPHTAVRTTDDFGLPAEAKEAVAFAILANQTWHRRPGTLPSATGARHAVILGQITPA
jgi:anhydro-N-acetylmuramic acid kinase